MSFKPRILVSLLSHDEEYQRLQAESAQAAATRLGIELEVTYAERNPVLQIQQIFRAVGRPPETRPEVVIVHSVSAVGVENAARAAVQAGIGWMLLNEKTPYLEKLRRELPGPLVGCVYVDNEEVGRIQGRIAKALVPGGGRIVCVEGPSMSGTSQSRRKGLEAELSGSRVPISRWIPGDFTELGAERAVRTWARNATEDVRPAAIVCQNDEMGAGAAAALQRHRPGWADIPITGCDGVPTCGQKLVAEKVLAATIVIPPRAGLAVEIAAKHLRHEPVPFASIVTPHALPTIREVASAAAQRVERSEPARTAAPVET
jgi:ABC-type sugar transport system substrate-binding protein